MLIGYARVSRQDQDLDNQIDALEKFGCEKVFSDKQSGSVADREGFLQCLDTLRKGDTLVVWKLDRLGRTVKQLINLMDQLQTRKISFISITDGIDVTTPVGKAMFQMMSIFAEMERTLNIERTKAGLERARARGRCGGRPFKLNKVQTEMLWKTYQDHSIPIQDICDQFEISEQTLYLYIRRYKQNQEKLKKG